MTRRPVSGSPATPPVGLPLTLLFLSGFAGLVYQVCWLRQLALLFGNTAYASATTLAIFFLGLSLGSHRWGGRAARVSNPLRAYGALELAAAASALGCFALEDVHRMVQTLLSRLTGSSDDPSIAANALLALGLLLPPAWFMGGTLPMMGEHAVAAGADLGRRATLLYAANTMGGATGALAGGFYLPALLGFRRSYLLAVAIGAVAGIVALLAGARTSGRARTTPLGASSREALPIGKSVPRATVLAVAFVSGFATLALEVLWTRMFAQVLHNSVYSFAAILVTFLISLGLGAALAHALCRRARLNPNDVLAAALCVAGILVALTPFTFHRFTAGLGYLAPLAGWTAYVGAVFGDAAAILLAPLLAMGVVFPYLTKVAARAGDGAGATLGRLGAVNTLGAILGSLVAGFVLLPHLGLWQSIRAVGLVYLAAAALVAAAFATPSPMRFAPVVLLAACAALLDPARLSTVRVDASHGEELVDSWEGAHGTVAVVRKQKGLRLEVDNYYSLGGTDAFTYEQTQADIPLLLHPEPKKAFFLGLGTGITAGAALAHPLESLTAVELIPEVVTASRSYFGDYTGRLFTDPRARIVVGDGRHYLSSTDESYDVIVSDLFIPWQAGAGSLYTVEHYRTVARRLAPGGLFAQWLPLFQLSREEFTIIARTMLAVFPQVTLWRGDFLPKSPIVALIGEMEPRPLDPERLAANFRRRRNDDAVTRQKVMALTMIFYGGNLSAMRRSALAGHPLNRDDRPIIEYSTPITQREERAGRASYFTAGELSDWFDELAPSLDRDPYLAKLDAEERGFARAGLALFQSKVQAGLGRTDEARRLAERFAELVPREVYESLRSKSRK